MWLLSVRKQEDYDFPVYCLEFYLEVTHSLDGHKIIRNFVFDIVGCTGDWTPKAFVEEGIA